MHGRLRVKTTEQQEAEQILEREKKLAKYDAGTKLLFKKRKEEVKDEETALQLSQILAVNPDFYTLWNYRREIFLSWEGEKSTDYIQNMLKSDLQFTEQCLGVNPKSYCAWHHRCWIMEHVNKPDWEAEIKICDAYLKLDGRNFHCWDYRRFAVARAGRLAADELAATERLIGTNFSNYSSWHYRSHLLVELYAPSTNAAAPIAEEKYLKELELVQNAAFTDPDDQAVWFYHRWLLQWRQPEAGIVSCRCTVRGEKALVVVTLSRPGRPREMQLTALADGQAITAWKSPSGEELDVIWVAWVDAPVAELSVEVTSSSEGVERVCCLPALVAGPETAAACLRRPVSAAASQVLRDELDNIWQLSELEPDNKWVLLSSVMLMWALDPHIHQRRILATIDQLTELDHLRRGYYCDLRSRFVTESRLEGVYKSGATQLTLSDCQLTTLYHANQLVAMTMLDVSNNKLRSLDLRYLVNVTDVIVSDNQLARVLLPVGELCRIKRLLLDNNKLAEVTSFVDTITESVQEVSIAGNPMCELADHREKLAHYLPKLDQRKDEL